MISELAVVSKTGRSDAVSAPIVRKIHTDGWPKISFPSIAVIGAVEEEFRKFYEKEYEPQRLLLDLSSSAYIEIATLQFVIAIIRDRRLRNLDTGLRLPAGEDHLRVRHFIRRWQYAEAVQVATGWKFREVVDASDVERYFQTEAGGGDQGNPYEGARVVYSGRYGEKIFSAEAYRFFGFTSWLFRQGSDGKSVIESAKDEWKQADQSVIEILKRQLKRPLPPKSAGISAKELDPENYLVSRVVFEAMTNAVRHPGASIIQSSSHMAQKLVSKDTEPDRERWIDNFFTIVYWDDGQSMLSTLKSAFASGLPISNPSEISATYLVVYDNHDPALRRAQIKRSTQTPTSVSSDEDFLISTIFPGVTSDVRGATEFINEQTEKLDRRLVKPGMGLYVLTSTVLDIFGGTVSFRTHKHFMNVSRLTKGQWPYYSREYGVSAETKPDYRVTISKFPDKMPPFLGNMITVRLPLSDDLEQ